jgi:hypothetical protein
LRTCEWVENDRMLQYRCCAHLTIRFERLNQFSPPEYYT